MPGQGERGLARVLEVGREAEGTATEARDDDDGQTNAARRVRTSSTHRGDRQDPGSPTAQSQRPERRERRGERNGIGKVELKRGGRIGRGESAGSGVAGRPGQEACRYGGER